MTKMPQRENAARGLGHAVRLGLALLASAAMTTPITLLADTGDLVVVVNERADVARMSAREIRKLFLGKSRKLPDGSRAVLARFEPVDTLFNERALERSDAQVTAAWSRLKFSGRVRTPHGFDSVEDIAAFVAATPNAIAYLPADGTLPAGVRTVFTVRP